MLLVENVSLEHRASVCPMSKQIAYLKGVQAIMIRGMLIVMWKKNDTFLKLSDECSACATNISLYDWWDKVFAKIKSKYTSS